MSFNAKNAKIAAETFAPARREYTPGAKSISAAVIRNQRGKGAPALAFGSRQKPQRESILRQAEGRAGADIHAAR